MPANIKIVNNIVKTGPVATAEQWLNKTKDVVLQQQADDAARLITDLGSALGNLKRDEDAEKRPLQDQIKTIIAKYRQLQAPLTDTRERVRARLQPYLERLQARTTKPTTRVGTTHNAVVLRSYWSAKVVNQARAYAAAVNEPEMLEALQTVANRFARASKGSAPLAGTKAIATQKTV